jgi:hypothetical protein
VEEGWLGMRQYTRQASVCMQGECVEGGQLSP